MIKSRGPAKKLAIKQKDVKLTGWANGKPHLCRRPVSRIFAFDRPL